MPNIFLGLFKTIIGMKALYYDFLWYPSTFHEYSAASRGWLRPYSTCGYTYQCPGDNNAGLTCKVPDNICNDSTNIGGDQNVLTGQAVIGRMHEVAVESDLILGGKYGTDIDVPILTIDDIPIVDEVGDPIYAYTIDGDTPKGATIDWIGLGDLYLVIEGHKSRYASIGIKDPSDIEFLGAGDTGTLQSAYYDVDDILTEPNDTAIRSRYGNGIWSNGSRLANTPGTCTGMSVMSADPDIQYYSDIGEDLPPTFLWLIAVIKVAITSNQVQFEVYIKPYDELLINKDLSVLLFDESIYSAAKLASDVGGMIAEYNKWHKVHSENVPLLEKYNYLAPVLFNQSGNEAVCSFSGTDNANTYDQLNYNVMKFNIDMSNTLFTVDRENTGIVIIDPSFIAGAPGTRTLTPIGSEECSGNELHSGYSDEYDATIIIASDYVGDLYVEASYEYYRIDQSTYNYTLVGVSGNWRVESDSLYSASGHTKIHTPWIIYTNPAFSAESTCSSVSQNQGNAFPLNPTYCGKEIGVDTRSTSRTYTNEDVSTIIIALDLRHNFIVYRYEQASGTNSGSGDTTETTTRETRSLVRKSVIGTDLGYSWDGWEVTDGYDTGDVVGPGYYPEDMCDGNSYNVVSDFYIPPVYNSQACYWAINKSGDIILSIKEDDIEVVGNTVSFNGDITAYHNYSSKADELTITVNEFLGLPLDTPIEDIAIRGLCLI